MDQMVAEWKEKIKEKQENWKATRHQRRKLK
jgi:hypothetical protein